MDVPVPSWADVGYLSAIPLTVAALVVHPATRGSGTRGPLLREWRRRRLTQLDLALDAGISPAI